MTETNEPTQWKKRLPRPDASSNKYSRGHALIVGGGISTTGAARLAAYGALRVGAGLVSIACDDTSLPVYAASLMSIMTKPCNDLRMLDSLLDDERITSVLIGPGCGVNEYTRERTLQILAHKRPCVIDADAISAFERSPKILFNALHPQAVLTPHEGEFKRVFTMKKTREASAANAAKESGAIVLLKGHDTLIATPDGKLSVNEKASPWLATAGSGDVLAGIITGLLAQGMAAYDAARTGAWIHSKAAEIFGPGLISEDLPDMIPAIREGLEA